MASELRTKKSVYQLMSLKLDDFSNSLGFFKRIPDSSNRMDQLFLKIPVDFISQSAHQNIHDIRLRVKRIIIDMLHNDGF